MKIFQSILFIIIGGSSIYLSGYRFEVEKVPVIVTKYNATVEQCDANPTITASGEKVKEGVIACPVYLKFGTIVWVDGEQYVCKDRMNKRYQHTPHFDIFSWNIEEAKQFGRQYKTIEIIR